MRHTRGFNLIELIAGYAGICLVAGIVFPRFVGPLDINTGSVPIHAPGSLLVEVSTPADTQGFAEVSRPGSYLPGYIVLELHNNRSTPLCDAVVRYDMKEPIIVNRRELGSAMTISGTTVAVRFPTIAPHEMATRAIDFRVRSQKYNERTAAGVLVPDNS